MLLNLSNHPFDKWGENQRTIAQAHYGSIQDLPFPQIAPTASTAQVVALAYSYLAQIQQTPSVTAVHLMGEMTFIVALTRLLQLEGIKVVCSTTERIVLEEKDGKKTMQFQFCQFREYPNV